MNWQKHVKDQINPIHSGKGSSYKVLRSYAKRRTSFKKGKNMSTTE